MKKTIIWATLSLAICAGSQAVAEDTLVDHLVATCKSDIENYCSQVTP